MAYNGKQVSLLLKASELSKLGYVVGLAKAKALAKVYDVDGGNEGDWDGLSIVLMGGVVCVDFDQPDFGLIGWHELPPTWKERSPHGYHLFYRVQSRSMYTDMTPKIKWRPSVDLLIRNEEASRKMQSRYASLHDEEDEESPPFFGHVLVAPSDGYRRLWPENNVPEKSKLTASPNWLMEALLE